MAKGTDYTLGITTRVKDHASKQLLGLGKTGRMAGKSIAAGFIKAQLALGALRIAIRGTVNLIRGLTVDVAEQGDVFAKMAKKLGIGIETLSAYKHVAELSGASFEGLANSLKLLSKNVFDASQGVGEAKDVLADLGIEVTDVSGALKKADVLFEEIADALKDVADTTAKAAIAQKIFGRSGLDMIPILNEGSKGIRAMVADAERLNLVYTEAGGIVSEKFVDAMKRFGDSIKGVKKVLGEELLPILTELFDEGTQWVIDHRKEVKAWAQTFVKDIGPAIRDFVVEARAGLQHVVDALNSIKKGFATLTLEIRFLTALVTDGGDAALKVWTDYATLMDDLPEIVRAATRELDAVGKAAEGAVPQLPDTDVEAVRTFWDAFKGGANDATEALAGTESQAFQLGATIMGATTTGLVGFFDVITQGTASASEAFEAMARDILRSLQRLAMNQLITKIFGAIFGAITPGLTTPVPASGVPVMAKGGITTRETLAHLHPNEAVIPLDRLGSMGGGGGNNYFTINSNQSPDEIANAVARKLRGNRGFRQTIRGAARSGL